MSKILDGIEGVIVFFEDICVGAETIEKHLKILEAIFQKFQEYNVRVNLDKSQFFCKSVQYCGYGLSKDGITKLKGKVEAISKVPEPQNTTQLKAFMGMVNFYGRFIPSLSTLAHHLYALLKKGVKFQFTAKCREAMEEIKQAIMSDKVLVHFDPKKKLLLATDASPHGVGAVLSHKMEDGSERPICFASRTLSQAEKNYSQIDKEELAIIYGVKKLYPYVYARPFTTIITDHRPLISIFHPERGIPKLSPVRMQHYAVFLQSFQYDIQYRRTEDHGNADALSRFPLKEEAQDALPGGEVYYNHQLSLLPVTTGIIRAELQKEEELQPLLLSMQTGDNKGDKKFMGPNLCEFSLQNGCLFWCHRVYVPSALRAQVLSVIHEGHLGIVRANALARSQVWWPRIDKDIETMIGNCGPCQATRNNATRLTPHPWEYPKEPMERLHVDYAGPFRNKHFLVVVDAFSNWLEVYPVTSMSSRVTMDCLGRFFASYGLPRILVSDNGSQFTSQEFREFCRENAITQKFSAPYHPATNGQAERNVQSLKNGLRTAALTGESVEQGLQKFLMAYRRFTHATTGVSPAELFLGRSIRTKLDLVREEAVTKRTSNEVKNTEPRSLNPGDRVAVRFYGQSDKWKFGVVTQKFGDPHYRVRVAD